ncbi:hypothetical protein [Desulfosporosinus sp. SB140]|uniref:hypothetical protein n=1 Tax=Desulfosporosinus paludis TaxID=3115649 RepID=UPI0038900D62
MNEPLSRFKGTNCVAYGQRRDEHIVQLIYAGTAFTRKQIEQIIIPKRKSSKRIMLYALSRLEKQRRIKKWQLSPQLPSIYYSRKPKQLDHVLLVNEVYCALLSQKKSWQIIEWKWRYEILGGIVVADAMANIYLEPDRKGRKVIFVEVERYPSKRFNKPEQYQKVYDSNWIREEWSAIKGNTAIFPTILIVTDEELIIKSDLDFKIASIEQVKKDIFRILRG